MTNRHKAFAKWLVVSKSSLSISHFLLSSPHQNQLITYIALLTISVTCSRIYYTRHAVSSRVATRLVCHIMRLVCIHMPTLFPKQVNEARIASYVTKIATQANHWFLYGLSLDAFDDTKTTHFNCYLCCCCFILYF
jgi:hypothetical protein